MAAALMHILWIVAAALVLGSWVFCALLLIGTRRYRAVPAPTLAGDEPISVLKPLHGLDEGLEANLRSFFEQDYAHFEILFAARQDSDPGLQLARRLAREYPHVRSRFCLTGEPAWPNAKAYSLHLMQQLADHDLLVMADSDIRVTPTLLATIAAEFADTRIAVATCPYRAVAGDSLWSQLEAVGMNTEFWGGVFTARLVEGGVHFTIGPTVAARRRVIDTIGGWPKLSEYLAEDFVLGNFAAAAGHGVILSRYVVEHRIGSQIMRANFAHRLRWNRSTRRSRPAGYTGQLFTMPLPLVCIAMLLWPWNQYTLCTLLVTLALRAWAALEVASNTLHEGTNPRFWGLLFLQDVLSFLFWIAGFFGNTILWRGHRYRLLADGRFERIPTRE